MASVLPPLLYQGSVKDVFGTSGKSPYFFQYSDRYSIFDWGTMPDELEDKGEALAMIADLLFRFFGNPSSWSHWELPLHLPRGLRNELENSSLMQSLRSNGLPNHSQGLVDAKLLPLPVGRRSRLLSVNAVTVLRPTEVRTPEAFTWDYSAYAARPELALVPLEVIFRLGIPEGSSFLARAERDKALLQEVGLETMPKSGEKLPFPVVEFSTKLEPSDRMLKRAEAQSIAGLSDEEFKNLCHLTQILAIRLQSLFTACGLDLWDGKFEFAFLREAKNGVRGFELVDSIGPDELRILRDGVHLSKEILRQYYRPTQWYKSIAEAKNQASREHQKDWKVVAVEHFQAKPEKVSRAARNAASRIYPAIANAIAVTTGVTPAFTAPSFDQLVRELKEVFPK